MSKTLLILNGIVLLFLPGITCEPPDVCRPPASAGRPYYVSCTVDTRRANVHWFLTSPTEAQTFLNPSNEAPDPHQQRVHANITVLPSGHSDTRLWFENVTPDDAGTVVQCVVTENRKPSRRVVVNCRLGLCRGNGSVRCGVNRTRGTHPVYRCGVESGSQTLRCGLRLEGHSLNATAYEFNDEFKYGTEAVHDGGHALYCQVEIAHVEPGNYSLTGTVDAGCGEVVNIIHGIVTEASKPMVSLTYESQTFRFCNPLMLYCEAQDFGDLASFQWFLDGNDATEKSKANCKTAKSCTSSLKLTPSDFGKEVTCLATAYQITTGTNIAAPSPPRKPPEFSHKSDVQNVVSIRMGEVFNLTCQDVEGNHTLKKLNLTCWKNGEIIASTYAVISRAHLPLTGSQTLDRATCSCSAFYENAKCIVLVSNVSVHVNTSEQSANASSRNWTSPGHTMTIVYITISAIATILLVLTLGLALLCCARLTRDSKRPNSPTHQLSDGISRNSSHIYEPVSTNRPTLEEIKQSEDEEAQWMEAELLVRPHPGRRILMDSLGYLLPQPNLPDIVNHHDNFNFLEDSSPAQQEYKETCFNSADSRRRDSGNSLSLIEAGFQQEAPPQSQNPQKFSHGRSQYFDEDEYITPLSLFAVSDTASSHDIFFSKRDEAFLFESGHRAAFCSRCGQHHQLPAADDDSNPRLAFSSPFARVPGVTSRDVNDDEVVDSGRSCFYDDEAINPEVPGADTHWHPQLQHQVAGADKTQRCGRRLSRCMSLGPYETVSVDDFRPASNSREDMDSREYSNWHPTKIKAKFHGFKSYSVPQGDYSRQNQGV